MYPITLIIMYIVTIAILILAIKFRSRQGFVLFILPVLITLLPFLIYSNELKNSTDEPFMHLGSAFIAIFYALPMTVVTLIAAIVSYRPMSKNKRIFAVIVVIIIIAAWIIRISI